MQLTVPFQINLSNPDYLAVLAHLHTTLKPETYLEIGTRTGDSLKLAKCASVAIDPAFSVSEDVIGIKPSCHFFQMTSDRFFERARVIDILNGPVEFAYLDGMHLAEFLLRDFINIEKLCRPNSIIVMHDCMPSDFYMTCRREHDETRSKSHFPDWWTGDVWKTIRILKRYRTDLTIVAIDSPPTGLICVTNLDPNSHVLKGKYAEIVRDLTTAPESEETLQEYLQDLTSIKPERISTPEQLSEFFYL